MLTEQEVIQEIQRAKLIHGPLSKDHARAALILSRETLEAIQEAADVTRLPRLSEQRVLALMNLRAELVQVVAVASLWVSNLDNERLRDEHERQANNRSTRGTMG